MWSMDVQIIQGSNDLPIQSIVPTITDMVSCADSNEYLPNGKLRRGTKIVEQLYGDVPESHLDCTPDSEVRPRCGEEQGKGLGTLGVGLCGRGRILRLLRQSVDQVHGRGLHWIP